MIIHSFFKSVLVDKEESDSRTDRFALVEETLGTYGEYGRVTE